VDEEPLPGVEGFAVGQGLQQGEGDRVGVCGPAAGASGGVDEAPFGPQDPLGGVAGGAGGLVDGGAVEAAERAGFLRQSAAGRDPDRLLRAERDADDPVDHPVDVVVGECGGADLAERFGADVPFLPGRPLGFDPVQHAAGGAGEPRVVDHRPRPGGRRPGGVEQAADAAGAEDLVGFGVPGGALVGFGEGLVFGLPGVQGGLGLEVDLFGRGRRAFVVGLEPGDQVGGAGVDVVAAL